MSSQRSVIASRASSIWRSAPFRCLPLPFPPGGAARKPRSSVSAWPSSVPTYAEICAIEPDWRVPSNSPTPCARVSAARSARRASSGAREAIRDEVPDACNATNPAAVKAAAYARPISSQGYSCSSRERFTAPGVAVPLNASAAAFPWRAVSTTACAALARAAGSR